MDLFFGKCGANSIDEAPKTISFYQTWVKKYVVFGSAYVSKIFKAHNLFTLMDMNHLKLAENKHIKATEKIQDLNDLGNLMTFANDLENGDL